MPSLKDFVGHVYTEAELEAILKESGEENSRDKFILPGGGLDHPAIWAKWNATKAGPPKRNGK